MIVKFRIYDTKDKGRATRIEPIHEFTETDLTIPLPRVGEIVIVQYWLGRVNSVAHDYTKNEIRINIKVVTF